MHRHVEIVGARAVVVGGVVVEVIRAVVVVGVAVGEVVVVPRCQLRWILRLESTIRFVRQSSSLVIDMPGAVFECSRGPI